VICGILLIMSISDGNIQAMDCMQFTSMYIYGAFCQEQIVCDT
jgi:hypothetical protein